MALSAKDQDTIVAVVQLAKFFHNNETRLFDLNKEYDTPDTGLKARLAALPNGGQDDLDALPGLGGITIAQLNDMAFVVTSEVSPVIQNKRHQLAPTWKVNV